MVNKMVTKEKNSLLIIEDDPGLQKQLKWGLKNQYEIYLQIRWLKLVRHLLVHVKGEGGLQFH